MNNSRKLGLLTGLTMMLITGSEWICYDIWAHVSPAIVYLNGTLLVTAGLGLAIFHNVWRRSWETVVTLVGYLCLAGGLYRIFQPNAPQLPAGPIAWTVIAGLFCVGVFLSAAALLTKDH
ncbi:MAG: hypothetical protein ACXU8U_06480 [Asticcacaulis sp.]